MDTKTIIQIVSDYYRLDVSDVIGLCQKRELIKARHISMYFAYNTSKESLVKIGSYFYGRSGEKDHATVTSALKSVKNQAETDRKYARDLVEIRKIIDERIAETELGYQEHEEVYQENDFYLV